MHHRTPKSHCLGLVAAVLAGLLLLAACIPATTPVPATPDLPTPEPVQLRVGTLPFVSNSILRIAEAEGFFTEQGLSVELVPFRSSNDLIPLLLTGEIDMATPGLTPAFFNAVAQGGNIRLALPLTDLWVQDCTTAAFLARKTDVEAKVYADPAKWAGAKVVLATLGLQSIVGYQLSRVLQQAGLEVSTVRLEKVDLPAQAEALRAGQVDIVYAVEPWVTRMQTEGDIALLLPAEPLSPGLTSSAIVFGARPLANPEAGKRFAVAYLKGVRQYLQGKTPRNVELIADYTGLEAPLVREVCWSHSPPDGRIDADSIMAYQTWLKAQGIVDRILEPSEFMDTSFADAANSILGTSTP